MAERLETIHHVAYEYTVGGLARLARRGEQHDVSAWDAESVERADLLGVFAAKGDAEVEAPSVESMDAAALAEYLTTHELNAKATAALCDGDPDLAAKVLEAENIATGGSPRKGVVKALAAVMNRND